MNSPINYEYPQDNCSDPLNASDYFDGYLESTQSSYSSLDSFGSQLDGPSFVTGLAPTWFTDFILYESDDFDFQADSMSVSPTSGSVRMDTSSDMATIPLFDSSPRSVPVSTDAAVPNDTSFYRSLYPTELDEANHDVAFGSNVPNFKWNLTEPALNLSASSHSESEPGKDLEQSSPEYSMSAQNDVAGRLPVPRMPYFKCRTCPSHYASESRLNEHLRRSHPPARFACGTCDRRFKQEKDLRRHQVTHKPQLFACLCTKTYARNDGLLRHFNDMATRPREAGRHKAVETNSR